MYHKEEGSDSVTFSDAKALTRTDVCCEPERKHADASLKPLRPSRPHNDRPLRRRQFVERYGQTSYQVLLNVPQIRRDTSSLQSLRDDLRLRRIGGEVDVTHEPAHGRVRLDEFSVRYFAERHRLASFLVVVLVFMRPLLSPVWRPYRTSASDAQATAKEADVGSIIFII